MLNNAFAHFKSEIEPGEVQVALLELLHDAQSVQIVVEASAERAHQLVELTLPGMAERRMSDVVNERQRFGEVGVQVQGARHSSRDLRDFESVGQAVAKMVGKTSGE